MSIIEKLEQERDKYKAAKDLADKIVNDKNELINKLSSKNSQLEQERDKYKSYALLFAKVIDKSTDPSIYWSTADKAEQVIADNK